MPKEPIGFSLWNARYNGLFPESTRIVNRRSFAVDSVSFRALEGESPVCLASRHSHWLWFCPMLTSSSTFLHPLAPRALPRFLATTGALTPVQAALRTLIRGIEHRPCPEQVSLVHTARPSMHSVTKHLTRPATASPLPAQRGRLPGLLSRSGLRLLSAGSSLRAAESCSSSYGLRVRLRLLSTPHHDDAVTFGYRERASPGGGLSPPRSRLLPGARIPAFAGMTERNVLSNSSLRRRPESSPWVSRAGPHPEDVYPIMDSLIETVPKKLV